MKELNNNITIYVHRRKYSVRREHCEDDETYFGKRTYVYFIFIHSYPHSNFHIVFYKRCIYTKRRTKSIDEQCVDCLTAWLCAHTGKSRQLLLKIGVGKIVDWNNNVHGNITKYGLWSSVNIQRYIVL